MSFAKKMSVLIILCGLVAIAAIILIVTSPELEIEKKAKMPPYLVEEIIPDEVIVIRTDGLADYNKSDRVLLGVQEVAKNYKLKSGVPINGYHSGGGSQTYAIILFVEPRRDERNTP